MVNAYLSYELILEHTLYNYLLVSQLFQAFLTPIASGGHVTSYDTGKFLGLWILPALRFFDKWDDVQNVLASFPQVEECEKNLWNKIKSHIIYPCIQLF